MRASGWAAREGGARRRVRVVCCFVVVVLEAVVGAEKSKSGVLSIVTEGAMVGCSVRGILWSKGGRLCCECKRECMDWVLGAIENR